MILALTLAIGLAIYSFQIGAEWLAINHRTSRKIYSDSFQRTENVFPKFNLNSDVQP